jgi:hypothetical protein
MNGKQKTTINALSLMTAVTIKNYINKGISHYLSTNNVS